MIPAASDATTLRSRLIALLAAVFVLTSTSGCVVWRDAPVRPRDRDTGSEPVAAVGRGATGGGAGARSGDDLDAYYYQGDGGQGAGSASDGNDAAQPGAATGAGAVADGERDVAPPTVAPTLTTAPTATPEPTSTTPPTPTPDPFTAAGRPMHLEVPSIGVDAYIEQVGLTAEQAMDTPREWGNVAWYRRGYRPGEIGNAVIAGHLDTSSGGPAVFWSLHELTPGDEIYVTYENGDRYTFVVEGSEYYLHDAQGPVIDRIFGESLTPDLNLITCDGAWDHGQATYSHRLVVFSTLAPNQTVSVDAPAAIE